MPTGLIVLHSPTNGSTYQKTIYRGSDVTQIASAELSLDVAYPVRFTFKNGDVKLVRFIYGGMISFGGGRIFAAQYQDETVVPFAQVATTECQTVHGNMLKFNTWSIEDIVDPTYEPIATSQETLDIMSSRISAIHASIASMINGASSS